MGRQLVLKPEKCVDCHTCELVCSFNHYEQFSPAMSAVTVIDFPEDVVTVPIMCLQCEEPACEKVCPVHAIAIKPDGLVYRDDDRCIVCKLCVQACPMGNIAYLESARKVFKCDLCGGDPQCAKWCSFGAIAFIDPADDRDRRKAIAESLKEVFKEEVA